MSDEILIIVTATRVSIPDVKRRNVHVSGTQLSWVDCGLTSHSAIFQLYSDGTDVSGTQSKIRNIYVRVACDDPGLQMR